jgi:hypothetical protein
MVSSAIVSWVFGYAYYNSLLGSASGVKILLIELLNYINKDLLASETLNSSLIATVINWWILYSIIP